MLLLRALLLGGLIVFLVAGAAVLFRRFFPRENPWLAFLVPPLALVLVLNFIEHFVALPYLGWLLPVVAAAAIWAVWKTPRELWRDLQLPAAIFTATVAFVLAIKSLHPMITNITEGVADLNRILDFCLGDKLPPTDGFLPPYTHQWYYTFQHYGASVVKRLFVLDIGTAYNFSFALVCAWVGLAGAGAAYHISQGRVWIAWLTLFLIETAFTGSSPVIALLSHGAPNPWLAINPTIDWDHPDKNPLSVVLAGDPYHETLKLFPPGAWTWFNEFHPTFAGQFLTLFSVLATMIVFLKERTTWAWICLGVLPLLTLVSATWFLPVVIVLCAGAAVVAWSTGFRPDNPRLAIVGMMVAAVLLWPTVAAFTTWSPHQTAGFNHPEWHTPLAVFFVQWWPIYLPWLLLCFVWPRLGVAGRWMHAVVPLLFIGVELFNVGEWRLDTVEKMWGAIYGVGLVTLVPLVLARRGLIFRLGSGLIVLAGLLSLWTWGGDTAGWVDWKNDVLHFEGDSYLVADARKARMLQILQQYHAATVLAGKCDWAYTEPPGLVVFSENRCYVAWSFSEDICGHAGEAEYRSQHNNDFYAGKLADPLAFLNDNGIAAVLIYPSDQISDAVLQALRSQLATGYRYVDCRGDSAENAGVFVRRPAPVTTPALPADAK
jgi:hypothetical protein